MPYYEVLCLASGKLQRAELGDILKKTCRAFMQNGGTVTRLSPLGADGNGPRKLAYSIRRNQVTYKTGFYVTVCAFASPAALTEVERQLKIDERVIRHLAVKRSYRDAVAPPPSIGDLPPAGGGLDPDDPEYALRKFLAEYERDFANSSSKLDGGVSQRSVAGGVVSRNSHGSPADSAVTNVLASLKASSEAAQEADKGLAWLSNLNNDLSDPKSPSKPN